MVGTSVEMYELNPFMEQTGKVFRTQVSDNSGFFEINNVNLSSEYVEFFANGTYYDEVAGGIPVASLDLSAISDIREKTTVNINILTHLEKERVKYLVSQGKKFSEAKDSAQAEIMAIFGLKEEGSDPSENLNISQSSQNNAVLIAISMILQGKRYPPDLAALLTNISNDIREDGVLNDENIKTNLRNQMLEINPLNIRKNLVNRYQELGVEAAIPEFEKYLLAYMALKPALPVAWNQWVTNINSSGATLNGKVNPNSLSTVVTFEYGTTTNYENSIPATQSPLLGYLVTNVDARITGLIPGTTYYYRIKAVNALGTVYSTGWQFTR
ncbi:MAG: fibronectin type III domain-containing protein [Bacteroidales bacterium]|nr:fibronectin type III domain-containing protein [Bacteroidales bacterium]